jgi:hypothetical protein
MDLDPDLIAAYQQAHYVVFGEPELVLRIGEPNAQLDALLEEEGAETAAYLTPANPRGEIWGEEENRAALETFLESLRETSYTCYEGEGRDPTGEWPPEPSLLIVGISRPAAEVLAEKLEQKAIVFIAKGRAPSLVFLE